MGLVGPVEVPVSLIAVEMSGPHQLGSIAQVPSGNEALVHCVTSWRCKSGFRNVRVHRTPKLRDPSYFRLL
jgi:hypothetical protein